MKMLFIFLLVLVSYVTKSQVVLVKDWDKRFGADVYEELNSIQPTSDGGYILAGHSQSGLNGDKTEYSKGRVDYWIVKTDANGNKQWDKTLGGNDEDYLLDGLQTSDGGYIFGGYSLSDKGKDKSENNRGSWDYWIIKTDANGNKQWDRTYGGTKGDDMYAIKQTGDKGYILCGNSISDSGADKTGHRIGATDYWIVKIDANGNKQWDKTYGGLLADDLYAVAQTTDGGYILGGVSKSGIGGDKTENARGGSDFWIIKIDANGNKQWDKTYGGTKNDDLTDIIQTSSGGYLAVGSSYSNNDGDKTEISRGFSDIWLVAIDVNGNKQWDKTYGGLSYDGAESVEVTKDGNYIIGGYSRSNISGDKTSQNRGEADYWLVKINNEGLKIWDADFGGDTLELASKVRQCRDGGFIAGGSSYSGISGDKTEATRGLLDYWIIKTKPEILPLTFVSFNATAKTNYSILNWQTANEINNDYFNIERSGNNKDFMSIAKIYSQGNGSFKYDFTDTNPFANNYYRIKQTDKDGKFTYSKVVSVSFNIQNTTIKIAPNPATGNSTLYLSSNNEKVKIKITDATGKLIWQISTSENSISIPSSSLVAGVYDVQVINSSGIENIRFIKE